MKTLKEELFFLVLALFVLTASCDRYPKVEAGFYASGTEVLVGREVVFNDISTGDPELWTWTFDGGTPATSVEQNPFKKEQMINGI